MVSGLMESVRGEWGGDVDLGDGQLQKQFEEYSDRISTVKGICRQLGNPVERSRTILDIAVIKKHLEDDLEFIPTGTLLIMFLIFT